MKTSFGAAARNERQRYSDKEFAVAADETVAIGGGSGSGHEENRVLQFAGSYSSRCLAAAAANDCHGCAVVRPLMRGKYVIRSNLYLGKLPLLALWLLPACLPGAYPPRSAVQKLHN